MWDVYSEELLTDPARPSGEFVKILKKVPHDVWAAQSTRNWLVLFEGDTLIVRQHRDGWRQFWVRIS